MKRSRLVAVGALTASFAWVLAGGCSSDEPSADANPTGGGSGPFGGTSNDAMQIADDAMGIAGGSGNMLNALCGDMGECVPDDSQACRNYQPPVELPGGGGGGAPDLGGAGLGGEGGGGGAGQAGQTNGGAGSGEAGASQGGISQGGTGDGGAGGQGGADGQPPLEPAFYGCQVARVGNQLERQCQAAGGGKVNAPCFSAGDCQAGLACVTEGEAGRCLRYCCEGDGTCGSGTYCADVPLRKLASDTSDAEQPRVPVCVPADDCSLEDKFPCENGSECRCKGNTACLVVRADGTTTCRVPGPGQQGDPCSTSSSTGSSPCAWNHVCSSVTQKCVKICNTDPAKDDCGDQKCQASSELPQNFGVCVGPVK